MVTPVRLLPDLSAIKSVFYHDPWKETYVRGHVGSETAGDSADQAVQLCSPASPNCQASGAVPKAFHLILYTGQWRKSLVFLLPNKESGS